MSHLDWRLVPGTVLPYVETCGPGDRATARITAERSVCRLNPPNILLFYGKYCWRGNGVSLQSATGVVFVWLQKVRL